jgi:hypothetical protein
MKFLLLVRLFLLGAVSVLVSAPPAYSVPIRAEDPAAGVQRRLIPAEGGFASADEGAVPADPRIIAAVAAWKTSPLYVDRLFAGSLGERDGALRSRIAGMPVPVYVALVPHGEWFAEKSDAVRLAGWLATANGKPGVYVVVNRTDASGAAHLVRTYAPSRVYQVADYDPPSQLDAYLSAIEVNDRYAAEPARTEALPPEPERSYVPEKFTVEKALGNGFGGFMIGAVGGVLAAGLLTALFGRRREGHR